MNDMNISVSLLRHEEKLISISEFDLNCIYAFICKIERNIRKISTLKWNKMK